jgi:amino acid adenylation domain-containing protein
VAAARTLTPDERRHQLDGLTAPAPPAPEATLHGRFEEWVAGTPDAPAVVWPGGAHTYAELDAHANRIAYELARHGVGRGQPVALLLTSGPLAVAAVLGVLKAGAAFACLDAAQPDARVRQVLDELKPALILVDERTAHRGGGPRWVVVDALADRPAGDPRLAVRPEEPAYLCYTSGSTGRPKGIRHAHRNLAQFVRWQSERFGIGPGLRVAQLASLGFDVAYCEIFGALCHGATLCVPPPGLAADPPRLLAWLRADRVGLLQVIPRLLREILAAADHDGEVLPDLRTLMFVGEALPADLVRAARLTLGDRVRIANIYGPTEVVAATVHVVRQPPAGSGSVPVGEPIPGRRLLLLDDTGQPAPPGVAGEVWISSRYLAEGYHGNDTETRARFVDSPLAEVSGRLYRTGDLCRRRPEDNLLEFAGRVDHQVKLNGVRVELEEVELAVLAHPEVRECVAAVRGDDTVQRLVAYVVAGAGVAAADVRDLLARRLPAAMVPADVVFLSALPRTPNGKVDRTALPAPPRSRATTDTYVPPGTELQARLATLLAEVLQLDRIGINDDFFQLGGNSLQAARFLNRVRESLAVDLALSDLLTAPTISATAAAVEAAQQRLGYDHRIAAVERELAHLGADEIRALLAERRSGPPATPPHSADDKTGSSDVDASS